MKSLAVGGISYSLLQVITQIELFLDSILEWPHV